MTTTSYDTCTLNTQKSYAVSVQTSPYCYVSTCACDNTGYCYASTCAGATVGTTVVFIVVISEVAFFVIIASMLSFLDHNT